MCCNETINHTTSEEDASSEDGYPPPETSRADDDPYIPPISFFLSRLIFPRSVNPRSKPLIQASPPKWKRFSVSAREQMPKRSWKTMTPTPAFRVLTREVCCRDRCHYLHFRLAASVAMASGSEKELFLQRDQPEVTIGKGSVISPKPLPESQGS